MADIRGLPLLSGPPPPIETPNADDACRKCNKEFNILFARSRKCNHCGYSYCHNCTDYQAMMPRPGGYDAVPVCAFCVELLTITAAGRHQLKTMSLAKLKKYINSYNIKIDRAVEKDDLIDAIILAKGPNGCLPHANENFYRKYSVPNKPPGRARGFFSRQQGQSSQGPPPPPVPPRTNNMPEFARPDLEPDGPPPPPSHSYPQSQPHSTYPPPPRPPPPQQQQYNAPPYPPPPRPHSAYGNAPPPSHNPPPQFHTPPPHGHGHGNRNWQPPQQQQAPPPPPPPPHYSRPPPAQPQPQQQQPPPQNYHTRPTPPHASQPPPFHAHSFPRSHPPPPPPQQQQHTSQPPPPPPRPRAASTPTPPPTLDQLLAMPPSAIGALGIGVLKSVLFTNHVPAGHGQILEKGDLVKKVLGLVEDERAERERMRRVEEMEEIERVQREEERRAEEEERERMRRQAQMDGSRESESGGAGGDGTAGDEQSHPHPEPSSSPPRAPPVAPPKTQGSATTLERTGLCVICQDEEANIAIVDCGHMAMCRACSDLVMASSRECPLCRTRIVTEARLLRIFKT